MAEPGTFHRDLYRDTSLPIPDRVRILEKHIRDTLVDEVRFEGNPKIGTADHQFTWGRGSSRQRYFLELERQRQALMLTELGGRLGLNEDECFNLLPDRFPKRPSSNYRRRGLNAPLLVPKFPGVSWQELIQAMEESVHYYPIGRIWTSDRLNERVDELKEWQDPQGFVTPDRPYATWVKIPPTLSSFFPRPHIWLLAPEQARLRMPQDARGATHWDGAALAFLRDDAKPFRYDWVAYYDLIGSQVGSDSVVATPRSFATIESSGLDVVPVHIEPVYFRGRKLFPIPPRTRAPIFCSREVVIKS